MMRNPPSNDRELRELFSRICDCIATEHEQDWLREQLRCKPRIRYLYWEYVSTESYVLLWSKSLEEARSADKAALVDVDAVFLHEPLDIQPVTRQHSADGPVRYRNWVGLAAAVAVLLLLSVGIVQRIQFNGDRGDLVSAAEEFGDRKVVAKVVGLAEAKWVSSLAEITVGSKLKKHQVVQLESGHCVIEFGVGNRVTLAGPSTLVVAGENAVSLQIGELSARIRDASKGFTVYTPDSTINDLGTQFGVRVGLEGKGLVSVFEGEVELVTETNDQPISLKAGKAALLDGELYESSDSSMDFILEHQLPSQRDDADAILPDKDGRLVLNAKNAEITGDLLIYDEEQNLLRRWGTTNDFPSWVVNVKKDDEYRFELDLGCGKLILGGSFAVKVDGKRIGDPLPVPETKSYQDIKTFQLGKLPLNAGKHVISFMSLKKEPIKNNGEGIPGAFLMSLREARLIPPDN